MCQLAPLHLREPIFLWMLSKTNIISGAFHIALQIKNALNNKNHHLKVKANALLFIHHFAFLCYTVSLFILERSVLVLHIDTQPVDGRRFPVHLSARSSLIILCSK